MLNRYYHQNFLNSERHQIYLDARVVKEDGTANFLNSERHQIYLDARVVRKGPIKFRLSSDDNLSLTSV